MADLLCTIMGILDIIAGIVIVVALDLNVFSLILGALMAMKGGFSLI